MSDLPRAERNPDGLIRSTSSRRPMANPLTPKPSILCSGLTGVATRRTWPPAVLRRSCIVGRSSYTSPCSPKSSERRSKNLKLLGPFDRELLSSDSTPQPCSPRRPRKWDGAGLDLEPILTHTYHVKSGELNVKFTDKRKLSFEEAFMEALRRQNPQTLNTLVCIKMPDERYCNRWGLTEPILKEAGLWDERSSDGT